MGRVGLPLAQEKDGSVLAPVPCGAHNRCMDIDVEIRYVSDDDAYMATVPELKAVLDEGSAAEITGADVESAYVASVIHLDDGDGD
ncbi:hypothetical protein AUR04nite_15220 [Glutamicibacter uratoxydans]|uniref:Uncharacterized protein n=1 Tax=Glutamicibacter uratoxydans TaxID=43667 RepID=A0A4Y4DR36_GLUUR|nr:hypothetical protein [Glutamicibacter uratoxydans]GED05990.1 hypothetical protein AUR04nite_15220 [Glutamicibacter uratoxydans]